MVNLSTSIELKILQLLNKIKRNWGKKKKLQTVQQ